MTTDIWERLHPLQLAVGSHRKGSGAGCAMNVISYENGDTEITDFPDCSDRGLARMVQMINDSICSHSEPKAVSLKAKNMIKTEAGTTIQVDGAPVKVLSLTVKFDSQSWKQEFGGVYHPPRLLCADCSIEVLKLGHRTVGTNIHKFGFSKSGIRRIYGQLAYEVAKDALDKMRNVQGYEHYRFGDAGRRALIDLEDALQDRQTYGGLRQVQLRAEVEARQQNLANAIYQIMFGDAEFGFAHTFSESTAGHSIPERLIRAHHLIDRFEFLTGIKAAPVDEPKLEAAVKEMRETVNA